MRVWRLCKAEHATFDGEGARTGGGRWNHPGTAIIYTSETLSLAALEFLVHVQPATMPDDLVAMAAEVPRGVAVREVRLGELPPGWREYPAPKELADLGTAWVAGLRTAVLSVPSAVIAQERNYLLNPRHPDFHKIRVGRRERFVLDPRLVQRP